MIKHQKYILILGIISINVVLITTFLVYPEKWYAFLPFLIFASLINASSVLLILSHKMGHAPMGVNQRSEAKNYIYIIPCYNESFTELQMMLTSIHAQQTFQGDTRSLLIICDGSVQGQGNDMATDGILKQILNIDEENEEPFINSYKTWDGRPNSVTMYEGEFKGLNYFLIIKATNYGKRDSLVLARQLCYEFNTNTGLTTHANEHLFDHIEPYLTCVYGGETIDYIIGIDADTLFDYNCSYELIRTMENGGPTVVGCVGLVDITPTYHPWSPFVLYQYAEYRIAQSLRRLTQSLVTGKVSCLSGCNQILRICKETCGAEILAKFNYLPPENDNLFNHIRSFASEDRNHVCLMLSMYPEVKTVQNMLAIAYTTVPNSFNVFFSQRRRWSLGASLNDLLLVTLPGINIFERISAVVNCINYVTSPFITVASAVMIKAFIQGPTYLMLMLSILIFIPQGYNLLLPFFQGFFFRQSLYFYLAYTVYIVVAIPLNLCIFANSVCNMDVLKWGKTRAVAKPAADLTGLTRLTVRKELAISFAEKETDC